MKPIDYWVSRYKCRDETIADFIRAVQDDVLREVSAERHVILRNQAGRLLRVLVYQAWAKESGTELQRAIADSMVKTAKKFLQETLDN